MTTMPKSVMCMLCGDVLFAGPGIHPIPRECLCGATIVIPTPTKGIIRWDSKRYEAEGYDEPEVEYTDEELTPHVAPPIPTTIDDIYQGWISEV